MELQCFKRNTQITLANVTKDRRCKFHLTIAMHIWFEAPVNASWTMDGTMGPYQILNVCFIFALHKAKTAPEFLLSLSSLLFLSFFLSRERKTFNWTHRPSWIKIKCSEYYVRKLISFAQEVVKRKVNAKEAHVWIKLCVLGFEILGKNTWMRVIIPKKPKKFRKIKTKKNIKKKRAKCSVWI